jgi:hypothetical protein
MTSRAWVKINCDFWLKGSLRDATPEVRGVMADLYCLAGGGLYGETGEIQITDKEGFPDESLAKVFNMPLEKFRAAKAKLMELKLIEVGVNNVIVISDWKEHQSEYNRQKRYRREQPQDLTNKSRQPVELRLPMNEIVTKR